MTNITNKTFKMTNINVGNKDVNYLNKDFSSLKAQLINFTKQYYPQKYKDFSDSSPGQIFIDQAAYVGDILSYYVDQQFQESFIQFATERKNIVNLARSLGYKPKVSSAASTIVEIFQLVPSEKYIYTDEFGVSEIRYRPNSNYYLMLKPYTSISSRSGVNFLIEDAIDFNQNTLFSPREVTVYERNSETNEPTKYVAKKTAQAFSGEVKTREISVGELTSFLTIKLPEQNILKIISITDSNNNAYGEVDYIAQETIPVVVDNISLNNQYLSQYKDETPKLLKYFRTEKRFITYVDEYNNTYIQFGGNYENFENDVIIPNPTNVGSCLRNLKNINISLDGTNILKNNSYGVSPSNTTLTIKYIVGGGLSSNINSGELTSVNSIDYINDITLIQNIQRDTFQTILNNVRVNNIDAATGGSGAESNEVIRQNAIANFSTQNRMVTANDILLRIYSMSSEFGSIAKAYVEQNSVKEVEYTNLVRGIVYDDGTEKADLSILNPLDRRKFLSSTNPFTNNVYLLGYDISKYLVKCNEATIFNLKNYLEQYKILTDKFNFIDGYVINIGVNFKISVYTGFNKRTVLNNCINVVRDFFNIDLMGFCQPINKSQLQFNIMNVEGVQSVASLDIINLTIDNNDTDTNRYYSEIAYNISIATQNNIIYPSQDPSVFEIKYPLYDIKGIVI